MKVSCRLFHCCRCHAQVMICSRCDHGQRYCVDGCATQARRDSGRRASKKYQATRRGRFMNARRQQRFRQRQRKKVTHQGSVSCPLHVLIPEPPISPEVCAQTTAHAEVLRCFCCGSVCDDCLRQDFMPRDRGKSTWRSFRH